MRTLLGLLLVPLFVCTAKCQSIVSTAEWNSNAEVVITLNKGAKDTTEFDVSFLKYIMYTIEQASIAGREDNGNKQAGFLLISYFNLKLLRQLINERKINPKEYDEIELRTRQLLESIRSGLLRFNIRVTAPYFPQWFSDYRRPFYDRREIELTLRAP